MPTTESATLAATDRSSIFFLALMIPPSPRMKLMTPRRHFSSGRLLRFSDIHAHYSEAPFNYVRLATSLLLRCPFHRGLFYVQTKMRPMTMAIKLEQRNRSLQIWNQAETAVYQAYWRKISIPSIIKMVLIYIGTLGTFMLTVVADFRRTVWHAKGAFHAKLTATGIRTDTSFCTALGKCTGTKRDVREVERAPGKRRATRPVLN